MLPQIQFVKNTAIMGGMRYIVLSGSESFSVDKNP